jgi:hypothetical protein
MPTGAENMQAIVDRFKTQTVPNLSARVLVILERIARTAGEGLTPEQVVLFEGELTALANSIDGIALDPNVVPPVEPFPTIPGPLVPGGDQPGPLERALVANRGQPGRPQTPR